MLDSASRGRLMSSYCAECKKYVWPPNYYCNICNSKTIFRDVVRRGTLIEKSLSHIHEKEGYFGVGEFNGVRFIGTINERILVGDIIQVKSVKVTEGRLDIVFTGVER
jgi:uncharacterized OB-fold protein